MKSQGPNNNLVGAVLLETRRVLAQAGQDFARIAANAASQIANLNDANGVDRATPVPPIAPREAAIAAFATHGESKNYPLIYAFVKAHDFRPRIDAVREGRPGIAGQADEEKVRGELAGLNNAERQALLAALLDEQGLRKAPSIDQLVAIMSSGGASDTAPREATAAAGEPKVKALGQEEAYEGSPVQILSAGKRALRTGNGTAISFPAEYPNELTRYFIVRPEMAIEAADVLSKLVSSWFKSKATSDGRLSIDIYEIEVRGTPLAMVCSGDPQFYFGASEINSVLRFQAQLADLDMRNLDKEQHGFFAGSRPQLERIASYLAR